MKNMLQQLKTLLKPKTALELAAKELEEARKSKLEAETAREYAASVVKYNTDRIARLSRYVMKEGGEK